MKRPSTCLFKTIFNKFRSINFGVFSSHFWLIHNIPSDTQCILFVEHIENFFNLRKKLSFQFYEKFSKYTKDSNGISKNLHTNSILRLLQIMDIKNKAPKTTRKQIVTRFWFSESTSKSCRKDRIKDSLCDRNYRKARKIPEMFSNLVACKKWFLWVMIRVKLFSGQENIVKASCKN